MNNCGKNVSVVLEGVNKFDLIVSYFGLKIGEDLWGRGSETLEKQCFYELRNKVPKEERCIYESQ